MSLEVAYRSQRLRIVTAVTLSVRRLWAQAETQQQDVFVGHAVPLVNAGQAHVVSLVDGYMAAKTQQKTGSGDVKGLDPALYTTDAIRGVPAADVYARPFGVLGSELANGAEYGLAKASAGDYLDKIVATDLQLAQTHSARDWMSGDERITGWKRVTSGGCAFCVTAAENTYHSGDLMPIHEHCHCSVEPVFGDVEAVSTGGEQDGELGSRLPTP